MPIRVVAVALVPLSELIAELDVLSVLAELPTLGLEEPLEAPGLLADSAIADVATDSVIMLTTRNHMNILPCLIHVPPRVFV